MNLMLELPGAFWKCCWHHRFYGPQKISEDRLRENMVLAHNL